MARIKGVDIPNDKRIEIALTYIYGIGRQLSNKILKDAKVNPDTKARDLTEDEISRIRDEVSKYLVEGDLRREVGLNIKTVRGQRTNRNARTRKGKGKTVANKKK